MRRSSLLLLSILCCACALVWALQPVGDKKKSSATAQKDQIILRHADRLYFNERINPIAQFVVGNVCFEHQGTLMYCDSALYYKETRSFDAFGNVRMVQGDTLSLHGDVMYYNGIQQIARVRANTHFNVVMKHRDMTLYADSMDYDRLYQVGRYFDGGKLIDQDNELTSDWGEYSPKTRDAVFHYNVVLVNPRPPKKAESTLLSDTLYYNTRTEIAHVTGPANIDRGNTHIYTENGYYYTKENQSILLDGSELTNVAKKIVGDSMHYDHATQDSKAYGHVYLDDRENKMRFTGHYALYNDSTGYAEAADSALCIDYSQDDTMYVHADTFKLYTYNIETDSVYRIMHAYNHVRAFRVDMQGVCDSLVYDGRDSCATMYKDPIMWQNGQQVLGEYIRAWVNDSTIDSIHVVNQALLVERIDSTHFDQLASKEIHSYFENGEAYLNIADINVFFNYHPFDSDSLMVGMMHAESSQMKMYLEKQQLQKIWMPATTGRMFPLDQIPSGMRYLENFAWFDYIRPIDKDDVFKWRSKKAGTELKQTVQHEAPKQSLDVVKRQRAAKKKGNVSTDMSRENDPEEAMDGASSDSQTDNPSDSKPNAPSDSQSDTTPTSQSDTTPTSQSDTTPTSQSDTSSDTQTSN